MRTLMNALSTRFVWAVCFIGWTLLGGVPARAEPVPDTPFVETGRQGMVVTANVQASEAGLEMLRQGGNAVDAAVAASFAISVTRPQSTGIGGGGFLLLHLAHSRKRDNSSSQEEITFPTEDKKVLAFDFRERAPLGATRDMFVREGKAVPALSRTGPLAVGVPGLVAGLVDVHEQHGSLPLADVMAPAIGLAENGFPVYPFLARALSYREEMLGNSPATRAVYFRQDRLLGEGELLIQKDLAASLRAIAATGKDAFYRGPIARALVAEMETRGGLITQADLERYQVIARTPVSGSFQNARIHAMPLPSSGGVLIIQMLKVLAGFPIQKFGFHTPTATHVLTETLRLAFRDRARYLGDADFVEVPVEMLVSDAYSRTLRDSIDLAQAGSSRGIPDAPGKIESTSTTHLSAIDAAGNAVSTTQTVNLFFGSGVMVPGTGIMLNNEMDDFNAQPDEPNAFGLLGKTDANAVAPGKTPLSSMTPTIVTRDGRVRLVVGGPGGSRIISSVLQILLGVLAYEQSLPQAMFAPRIHHQWFPDRLDVEVWTPPPTPPAYGGGLGGDEGLVEALKQLGHTVRVLESGPGKFSRFGNIQAISVDPDSGLITGVADPRAGGRPRGF